MTAKHIKIIEQLETRICSFSDDEKYVIFELLIKNKAHKIAELFFLKGEVNKVNEIIAENA